MSNAEFGFRALVQHADNLSKSYDIAGDLLGHKTRS